MKLTERKRLDVVNAAIEVFHDQGYSNAKMDQIAEVAEVSKRTVYNHFASKEELFIAILDTMVAMFSKAWQLKPNPALSLAEQLQAFAESQAEMYRDPQLSKLIKIVMAATLNRDFDLNELQNKVVKPETEFSQWMEKQVELGRLIDDDANDLTSVFSNLLKAELFWPHLVMDQELPDINTSYNICARTVRMFLSEFAVKT